MNYRKIFFNAIYVAAIAAALPCLNYAQSYDEDPFEDETSQNTSPWHVSEMFDSLPADMSADNITVSTDTVTESYRLFVKALLDEKNGDIDSAMAGLRKTIDAVSDDIYLYQYATEFALENGEYEDAEIWSEYIIKKDPKKAQNWVLFGNAKWANEHYSKAEAAYTKALALDPNNTEALFQKASLISDNQPETSIKLLKKCKSLRPDDAAEINYRIAMIYVNMNNMSMTEKYLLMAIDNDPAHIKSWKALAEISEIKKDYKHQMLSLKMIEKINPDDIGNLKRIAELNLERDPEIAEEYFRNINNINMGDPVACLWLAATAEYKNDYAEAASQLADSSALMSNPDLILRLSFFYTQIKREKDSVALMETAREKFPENNDIAYYLALLKDDLNDPQSAYEILDFLVRKEPENLDYRYQLGQICDKLDKMEEMEKHFKYILEKKPDNASVLNYLGYSLADKNLKLEEAKEYIEKALKISPKEGAFMDSLAWVHYRLGNYNEAKKEIIRAKNIISEDYIIWDHYGDIFNALGEFQEAWKAWNIALLVIDKDKDASVISKKIMKLEKKMPAESASILRTAFADKFIAHGKNLSYFGQVELTVRKKTVKMDVIMSYSGNDQLKMTFLSPFYTPAGEVVIKGNEAIFSELPKIDGMEKYADSAKSWLGAMLMDLRDFYMGSYNKVFVKNWKSKSYVSELGAKVSFDKKHRLLPGIIKSARNKKINISISEYYFNGHYYFPSVIEYKVPFVKAKITMKTEKLNYKQQNDFKTFVKAQP